MIILDFLTDRGENAACQDQEVSEWGGDNTLIATPGARTQIHVCYITYESSVVMNIIL